MSSTPRSNSRYSTNAASRVRLSIATDFATAYGLSAPSTYPASKYGSTDVSEAMLRDFMIPILRELGFRYDVSVCTSRGLLGKDFGHTHVAANPYRFRERFSRPDPDGDMVEIPLFRQA